MTRLSSSFFCMLGSLVMFVSVSVTLVHAQVVPVSPFTPTETATQLQAKYNSALKTGQKVHILIVPGHEPDFGGAEYQNLKERDIVLGIANELEALLEKNPHYVVTVTRGSTDWDPIFSNYFEGNWQSIQDFITQKRAQMATFIGDGIVTSNNFEVDHNTAPDDVATRLYGITKWANEHNVDITINLHLNDNTDHPVDMPGNHSGFAIYVPDPQYGNAQTSKTIATAIDLRLDRYNATSTLPIENYGVVPDQSLIALGSNNSANYASLLIEYAYIYESKITNPTIQPVALKDFAYQTYMGVQDFFHDPVRTRSTLILPHRWTTSPALNTTSVATYALQAALHTLDLYPTPDETLLDCPVSGFMGPCTVNSIKAFQKSKGLPQTGALGPATRAALNKLFGA